VHNAVTIVSLFACAGLIIASVFLALGAPESGTVMLLPRLGIVVLHVVIEVIVAIGTYCIQLVEIVPSVVDVLSAAVISDNVPIGLLVTIVEINAELLGGPRLAFLVGKLETTRTLQLAAEVASVPVRCCALLAGIFTLRAFEEDIAMDAVGAAFAAVSPSHFFLTSSFGGQGMAREK